MGEGFGFWSCCIYYDNQVMYRCRPSLRRECGSYVTAGERVIPSKEYKERKCIVCSYFQV